MKKTLTTIIIIFSFYVGYSQENSTNQDIKAVNKQIKKVDSDLKLDIDALRKELVSVKLDLEESKKLILRNTGLYVKTNEAKLNQRKHLIVKTTEFVKTANKSFNAIDASISQAVFLKDVTKLNNPTNDDLGFSLEQIIKDLIGKHILEKDKKLNKSGRVNSFVNSIIEHPITEIAKTAIPAINTVIGFVSNISFGSKKISAEDFDSFNKDLKKYIEHYEGLANATKEFEINIEQTKIRTLALQKILQNFTIDRLNTINEKEIIIPENYGLTDIIANYYQDDMIIKKLSLIEKDNKNSPSSLLTDKRLIYPVTALNQARFITDELENITNQYTRAHFSYYAMIIKTLEKSKKLEGANPTSIDDKKLQFEDNVNVWIKKFENLVDSKDVKKEFEELIQESTVANTVYN